MYNQCRTTPEPILNDESKWIWPKADDVWRLCSLEGSGGAYTCPEPYTCGHPLQFPNKPVALEDDGVANDELISYGIPTFDSMVIGLVTIF